MVTQISLQPFVTGHMLGTRVTASPVRKKVEEVLGLGGEVVIDFTGVNATQSFVDELVGVLILKQGPDVLKHVKFKSCSEDMRAIVKFVVSDRLEQYSQPH